MEKRSDKIKKYDVVIVGAGPGGLHCAEILGKHGRSVLLLEKNEIIGPKVCAGGLTGKAVKLLCLPPEITKKKFSRIVFRKGNLRTEIDFGEDFVCVIEREKLGKWQLEKLKKLSKNVTIQTETTVTGIENEYIIIDNSKKIKFKYLVGADGSNSIIRRSLGLKTEKLGVGFQYLISKEDPKFARCKNIEIIFDSRLFHSWYAWIFPHDEYISTGSGYFGKVMEAKKTIGNYKRWATKEGFSDIDQKEFQAFPINCDFQGFDFGNKFLIGDAAGLASGFTGEGIYQALASGEDVAKLIIDPSHECLLIKEALREKKVQELLLLAILWSEPLRNLVFSIVIIGIRVKFLGRILLRILT